ncbi:DNA repair protein rad51c [Actinomortierella wolfii]|nr:DNA repair protein rad51c [Actinomortierella wolfii]
MSPESRPVATLSLSARLMDKVLKSGFSTVSDLQSIPQGQLQFELTLTAEEAHELWTQLHPPAVFPIVLDALRAQTQEWRWMPVTTSCQALDKLLSHQGGGVRPGEVTEFCGFAGVGKSQLGMQLSINVQLPPSLGGVSGSSIYIDTEGGFVAKRVQEMAMSSVSLLHEHGFTDWTTDTILEGVRYCRVLNPVELLAMIRMLRSIVKEDSKVRLIIVDSIAFLFRSNISNVRMRTKLIGLMAKQLKEIAQEFNLATVLFKLTNEGLRDLTPEDTEGTSKRQQKKNNVSQDQHEAQQKEERGEVGGDDDWLGEDGEGGLVMDFLASVDWADIWEDEEEATTAPGSRGSPAIDDEEMQSQAPSSPAIS